MEEVVNAIIPAMIAGGLLWFGWVRLKEARDKKKGPGILKERTGSPIERILEANKKEKASKKKVVSKKKVSKKKTKKKNPKKKGKKKNPKKKK